MSLCVETVVRPGDLGNRDASLFPVVYRVNPPRVDLCGDETIPPDRGSGGDLLSDWVGTHNSVREETHGRGPTTRDPLEGDPQVGFTLEDPRTGTHGQRPGGWELEGGVGPGGAHGWGVRETSGARGRDRDPRPGTGEGTHGRGLAGGSCASGHVLLQYLAGRDVQVLHPHRARASSAPGAPAS